MFDDKAMNYLTICKCGMQVNNITPSKVLRLLSHRILHIDQTTKMKQTITCSSKFAIELKTTIAADLVPADLMPVPWGEQFNQ